MKRAKAAVGYERPAKGSNHCGVCRHYRVPRSCSLVLGDIAPGDWCTLFAAAARTLRGTIEDAAKKAAA